MLSHFSWEDEGFKKKMINNMERKNGIQKGIVLIRRLGRFVLLYSFATKYDPVDFSSDIHEDRSYFYSVGDHCYSMIKTIYEGYSQQYGAPLLTNLGVVDGAIMKNETPNSRVKPDLRVID